MKLRTLLFAMSLALAGSAFAASPSPSSSTGMGPMGRHEGPCKTDPQMCKDEAAKFDTWCAANADKCTSLKAWMEKHREKCEANPKKCEERMRKMHEHMKDMKQSGDDESGDDQGPPPPSA